MGFSDDELLQALLLDLDDNFKYLVESYDEALRKYAISLTRNKEDADDIMQGCWKKVYQALDRYPRRAIQQLQLKSWLYKIVHNEVINLVSEKKKVAQVVSIDVMREDGEEIADNEKLQPEDIFEVKESVREVRAAIATLPTAERSALNLRFFVGLDYEEIAIRQQRPVKNVRMSVYRGLEQLRNKLANVI